jgi:hypothetical protein
MAAAINSNGQRLEVFGLTFREHHNLRMQQVLRQYNRLGLQEGPPNRALLFTQLFDLAKELNEDHKEDQVERIQSWLKNGGEFPIPPPTSPVIEDSVESGWEVAAQIILEEDRIAGTFVGGNPDGQHQNAERGEENHETVDEVMEDQNGSDGEWPEYNPAEYESANQYPGPNTHMNTDVTAGSQTQDELRTSMINGVENLSTDSAASTSGHVIDDSRDAVRPESQPSLDDKGPTDIVGNTSNPQQPLTSTHTVSHEGTSSSLESDEEPPARRTRRMDGFRGRGRGRGGNMYRGNMHRNHHQIGPEIANTFRDPTNPFPGGHRLDGLPPAEAVQPDDMFQENIYPGGNHGWGGHGGLPEIHGAGHRLDGVQPNPMFHENDRPGENPGWDGHGALPPTHGAGHRFDGMNPEDTQAFLHAEEARLAQALLRVRHNLRQNRHAQDDGNHEFGNGPRRRWDRHDMRAPLLDLPPVHQVREATPFPSGKSEQVDSTHMECDVCTDTYPPDMFPPTSKITANCEEHMGKACIPCIQRSIQSTLDEGSIHRLTCLFCHHRLTSEDIEKYATKTALARYKYLMLLDSPDITMCLSPTCKAGQKHTDKDNPKMICETCSFATCVVHKLPWHENVTCAEFDSSEEQIERLEEAEATAKLLAKEQSQICPECHQGVFRSEGCDHMMCKSTPPPPLPFFSKTFLTYPRSLRKRMVLPLSRLLG